MRAVGVSAQINDALRDIALAMGLSTHTNKAVILQEALVLLRRRATTGAGAVAAAVPSGRGDVAAAAAAGGGAASPCAYITVPVSGATKVRRGSVAAGSGSNGNASAKAYVSPPRPTSSPARKERPCKQRRIAVHGDDMDAPAAAVRMKPSTPTSATTTGGSAGGVGSDGVVACKAEPAPLPGVMLAMMPDGSVAPVPMSVPVPGDVTASTDAAGQMQMAMQMQMQMAMQMQMMQHMQLLWQMQSCGQQQQQQQHVLQGGPELSKVHGGAPAPRGGSAGCPDSSTVDGDTATAPLAMGVNGICVRGGDDAGRACA